MNTLTSKELLGKILISGQKIERIWQDEKSGFFIALLRDEKGNHGHEKSTDEGQLLRKLQRQIERRDMKWILSRLSLLNVSELARQAGVPRHKLADAERGKGKLTEEECVAIRKVIDSNLK